MKKIFINLLSILSLFMMPIITFADEINTVDCGVISDITLRAAHIIMIAAPILLLVLTTVDGMGYVASGDEKARKKCISNLIKRFIICVVILILPLLVNIIIGWTTFKNLTACFG